MIERWNENIEKNRMTDFQTFRLFLVGNWEENEYRKAGESYWIRSIYTRYKFLAINKSGYLGCPDRMDELHGVYYKAQKRRVAFATLLFIQIIARNARSSSETATSSICSILYSLIDGLKSTNTYELLMIFKRVCTIGFSLIGNSIR